MGKLDLLKRDMLSGVSFNPDTLYELFADKSNVISSLMRVKAPKEAVRVFIVREIKRVLHPYIALPHFNPDAKRQQLEYYDGKCWYKYDDDAYYKLVRKCAERIGLPPEFENCSSFMNRLYLDVAHALHEPMKLKIPERELWINVRNGVLKIKADGKTELEPHERNHYFHYVLPYGYDPEAECARFMKYLSEVLPDADTRSVIQEFVGYGLIHDCKAEKMLVLSGPGSNGKSVLIKCLYEMYGKENVSTESLSDVTTNDEKRRKLEDKLMNFSYESDTKLNNAVLKQMVSGEPVDIRELYHGSRTMTNYGKFITSFNTLPKPEQTNAFFRRWILVSFKRIFEGKDVDKSLADKIIAEELPGILNWAIAGLKRLVQNDFDFTESKECADELKKYRMSSDSVALFVDECCEVNVGARRLASDVVSDYTCYCYDNDLKPVGKKILYRRLKEEFHVAHYEPSRILYFDLTLKNA